MNLDWPLLLLAVAGSFLAGVINTLAGNGSAITLAFMTEVMGMPGNLANGTPNSTAQAMERHAGRIRRIGNISGRERAGRRPTPAPGRPRA